jgi:hypothetical protein
MSRLVGRDEGAALGLTARKVKPRALDAPAMQWRFIMAFPLIPFAAGLAVGSIATYAATDKPLQQRVVSWSSATVTKVREGAGKLASAVPAFGRSTKAKAAEAIGAAQEGASSFSAKARAVVDDALKKAKRDAKVSDDESAAES